MTQGTAPVRYVPDASVAAKLFLPEPHSPKARAFFSLLETDPEARFFAPEFLDTEVANVLWKHVRRGEMTEALALVNLRSLRKLDIERLRTEAILEDALRLAVKHGVTVYDASYVAAARVARAKMVTADEPLARAIWGGDVEVILIQEAVADQTE